MIAVAFLSLLLASPNVVVASYEGPNWSGFVQYPATSTDNWQQVSGQFSIPTIDCSGESNDAAIAIWVGVGGSDGVPQLFQAGVNATCSNGVQLNGAWWTDDNHSYVSQYFTNTPLSSGDSIAVKLSNTTTTTVNHRDSKVVRRVRHLWRWRTVDGRRVRRKTSVVTRHRVYFNVPVTVTTPAWSATVEDVSTGTSWQASDASWTEPADASAEWIVEDPGVAGYAFTCDQGTNCAPVPSFTSVSFSSGSDTSASGAPGSTPQLWEEFGNLQTPLQSEFLCPTAQGANNGFDVAYQTSECPT